MFGMILFFFSLLFGMGDLFDLSKMTSMDLQMSLFLEEPSFLCVLNHDS